MIDEKKIEEAAYAFLEKTREAYTWDCGIVSYSTEIKEIENEIKDDFVAGALWAQQEFVKSLWHDASEEPRKGANCILHISCEFEENPEDNYQEYTTAVYLGGGFSEDHFPSEADVYTMKWAYLDDILPKKGGEG